MTIFCNNNNNNNNNNNFIIDIKSLNYALKMVYYTHGRENQQKRSGLEVGTLL
jgi:hypothetical protein